MTTESVHGQGEDALPEVVVDAWTFHLIFCAEIMTQVGDLPDEVVLFFLASGVGDGGVCNGIVQCDIRQIGYLSVLRHDEGYLNILAAEVLIPEQVGIFLIGPQEDLAPIE